MFGIGAFIYMVNNDKAPAPRAVAGAPSGNQSAPAASQPARNMEMPQEVKKLLGDLETKAKQNPEDTGAWLDLTRARYRASVLNSQYHDGAKTALAHLFEIDPGNLEGVRISGNLAYDELDFDKAEKQFRLFLKSDPNDVGVITDLGSSLLFHDRIDDAIKEYNRAVEINPEFLQAWFNLGVAYQKLGDSDEAVKALTTARSLTDEPDRRAFIDEAIASAKGEPEALPPNHPSIGAGGTGDAGGAAGAKPKAAAGGNAKSNASTDFQRAAQELLLDHPIVGPRITQIVWSGAAQARIGLANFPMDQMPPAVRDGFISRINEELAQLATAQSVTDPIKIDLVDSAADRLMETLDGKN